MRTSYPEWIVEQAPHVRKALAGSALRATHQSVLGVHDLCALTLPASDRSGMKVSAARRAHQESRGSSRKHKRESTKIRGQPGPQTVLLRPVDVPAGSRRVRGSMPFSPRRVVSTERMRRPQPRSAIRTAPRWVRSSNRASTSRAPPSQPASLRRPSLVGLCTVAGSGGPETY